MEGVCGGGVVRLSKVNPIPVFRFLCKACGFHGQSNQVAVVYADLDDEIFTYYCEVCGNVLSEGGVLIGKHDAS